MWTVGGQSYHSFNFGCDYILIFYCSLNYSTHLSMKKGDELTVRPLYEAGFSSMTQNLDQNESNFCLLKGENVGCGFIQGQLIKRY